MSAEIIDLPVVRIERHRGNGAREALIAHAVEEFANTTQDDAEKWADFTLAAMWARGFKMVPVEE
jgi:hypothetical protein